MTIVDNTLTHNRFEITEQEWETLARSVGAHLPEREVSATYGSPVAGTGVRYLGLVRESGVSQKDALRGLNERTLITLPGDSGGEILLREGIRPLTNPRQFPGVIYRTLPDGGRACVWARGDTWLVLILGSAAMDNIDSNGEPATKQADAVQNAISVFVHSVLDRLRPRICRVGGFDRLVRAFKSSSSMFEAFKRNVGWLEFGHISMSMMDPTASQQWQNHTLQSTAAHHATVDKTTEGTLSAARIGLWPWADFSTPPGLAKTPDRRLVVDPIEQGAFKIVLEGLADPDPVLSDIVRRLIAAGLPPRRRKAWVERMRSGVLTPIVTGDNEHSRVEKWVQQVREHLPDLAMGKFVKSYLQPRSFDQTYLGFRPVYVDGAKYHQLAWDVPDALVTEAGEPLVQEDVLARAVQNAVTWRVERGMVPSAWLHELHERAKASECLSQPRDLHDPVVDQLVRWGRMDGSMISVLAPGRHPRSDRIKGVVLAAAAAAGPRHRRPNQPRNGTLTGMPAWINDAGNESWLGAGIGVCYMLYARQPDRGIDPVASLLRAKTYYEERNKEYGLARVDRLALHRSIAEAIARAIEDGAPFAATSHHLADTIAETIDDTDALTRTTLEGERANLTARIKEAKKTAKTLQRARMLLEGEPNTPQDTVEASMRALEIEDAKQEAKDAYRDVAKLEAELADLKTPQPKAAPSLAQNLELTDLELFLDMLVTLATETHATARAIRMVHKLIPRFRAWVDGSFLHWELTCVVGLPSGEDYPIGPIRGRVITKMRRGKTAKLWPEHHARFLCTVDTDATVLFDGANLAPKKKVGTPAQRRIENHAVKYLGPLIGPRQARVALTCPSLEIRKLIWNLAHDSDPTQHVAVDLPGLTDEYTALIAKTYAKGSGIANRRYLDWSTPKQPILDVVLEAGGQMDADAFAEALTPDPAATPQAKALRASNWVNAANASAWMSPIETVKENDADTRSTCRIVEFRAVRCPHCAREGHGRSIDMVLRLAEVPTGLLCSRCMRTPLADSPTYPSVYRDVWHQLNRGASR